MTEASRSTERWRACTHERRCKLAATKQLLAKPSKYEAALAAALRAIGLVPIHEFAVDKYNIDLALPEKKLAIEVFGGNWRTTTKKQAQDKQKALYLTANGWTVLTIKTRNLRWLDEAIAKIMASL